MRQSLVLVVLQSLVIGNLCHGASFYGLGPSPFGENTDYDISQISSDGSTVFGSIFSFGEPGPTPQSPYSWTKQGGFVQNMSVNGFGLTFSTDGQTISGSTASNAFRWRSDTGLQTLPGVVGKTQLGMGAFGISGDGNVVVGEFGFEVTPQLHDRGAFRWSEDSATELIDLGQDACCSFAEDASANGSVIVGQRGIPGETQDGHVVNEAFWWNNNATVGLGHFGPNLQGFRDSFAAAVSSDGRVVVGGSTSPAGNRVFRWTQQSGLQDIGTFPGGSSLGYRDQSRSSNMISGNGSVIVGDDNGSAFIWREASGIKPLHDVLANEYGLGSQLQGWTLSNAVAVSDNGRIIAGYGTNPSGQADAWVADLATEPKRHLVLVTHGRTDQAAGWPMQIRNNIESQLTNKYAGDETVEVGRLQWSEDDRSLEHVLAGEAEDVWEVATVDWSDSANVSVFQSAVNGYKVGKKIGSLLRQEDYETVHLIGHSAGSWLIEAIADTLATGTEAGFSRPDVHQTFLDAFTPYNTLLGNTADWVEHYVNGNDLILTNETLLNGFNIDITSLDLDLNDSGHWWPWQWYRNSTATPQSSVMHGWGFQQTEAYSGRHPRFGDVVDGVRLLPGTRIDLASGAISQLGGLPVDVITSSVPVGPENTIVSDTGQVTFGDRSFELATGSPVSLSAEIDVFEGANLVQFNYEFLSVQQGLLSVLFNDQVIFIAEEQYSPGVEHSDWVWLGGDFLPGKYKLTFLLEPLSEAQSVIRLSNLELGRLQVIPEPSIVVLLVSGIAFVGILRASNYIVR